MRLTVTTPTVFKLKPLPSSKLEPQDMLSIPKGASFGVLHHIPAKGKHFLVNFDKGIGPEDRNTWHVFNEHAEIEGIEPNNDPHDSEPENYDRGRSIQLPGFRSAFYLGDPIRKGGSFTWGEATKNGTRIPVNRRIVDGILQSADMMQDIRERLGDRPIIVTSWYRDPITNRRVGGARQSQHLTGKAVDFKVKGLTPLQVGQTLYPWWGTRGGLAVGGSFTHGDARGYRAFWSYRGGPPVSRWT